jgi:hypothetical protein
VRRNVGARPLNSGVRHHLKGSACVSLLVFGFAACATKPSSLSLPADVIGTVSSPRITDWRLDLCKEEPECVQIGGEIYEVTLSNVRTPSGKRLASQVTIGFPAHGLTPKYRARVRLHLDTPSLGFRQATGIEYLAKDWEHVMPNISLQRDRVR